ncbi:MAG: hypothetical protein P8Y70_14135 [Candidatus Lokiarchaeota archaeon]
MLRFARMGSTNEKKAIMIIKTDMADGMIELRKVDKLVRAKRNRARKA